MPGTYFGPWGEQYNDYASQNNANNGRYPMGHGLVLPDGRVYRFALNDATAEVAGRLYQSVVGLADHTDATANVARAAGVAIISATLGATAAAIDIYAEGIAHINDAGTDTTTEGYVYRIIRAHTAGAAHAAAAASAVLTVNLAAGEDVQVALTTLSQMSFTRNRFHAVLITAAPPTARLAGVAPGVAAASRFYWSQVGGEAAILADGTMLEGLPVQASVGTAGAVESHKRRIRTSSTAVSDLTSFTTIEDQGGTAVVVEVGGVAIDTTYDITGPISINAPLVGTCIKANATTEEALIDVLYLQSGHGSWGM